ncbi:NAD-dependent succinate-semialdehyde dehydrogenase [Salinicola sp. MIT1003]|uniref:NAD-dependent succinate-semialdehyde dehydrogenase n=1 Tax=Salinicola sp. MIT1003 TaxID=1882734 RepID=UPI0009F579D6|nr:NAD-dependent succinate-semialdehyde dehydrogenase [Salinicola sp. MIT1003]
MSSSSTSSSSTPLQNQSAPSPQSQLASLEAPADAAYYPAAIVGFDADGAGRYAVRSPATGEVIAEVADCGVEQAKLAADNAQRGFESWRRTTAFERAALLKAWHQAMLEAKEVLAVTMAREMGKPIREARGEVDYAASFLEWYAEQAKRIDGDILPAQHPDKRLAVLRQPVGPVLAITPWNFPAAMITRKVAPGLAAGCTVIVKPAEQTPITALQLAQLWQQVGGPAEVFQVITAERPAAVSDALMDDRRIRKVTFTGSTPVGKHLYAKSAATMKRMSLELGGHAPFLVFDDADIDAAVAEVMASKFRNGGQTCVCANRIYVQRGILETFSARLTAAVDELRVGQPEDESTQIGPLVSQAGRDKAQSHIDDALSKGARRLTAARDVDGFFVAPTVLADVTDDMRIMQEETFGPVAPLIAFDSEEEAIAAANATPFGLAAYLWTRNLGRAARVSEALDYGIVGVNDGAPSVPQAPFGGVKDSGLGREGGRYGIDEYLDLKFVSTRLDG